MAPRLTLIAGDGTGFLREDEGLLVIAARGAAQVAVLGAPDAELEISEAWPVHVHRERLALAPRFGSLNALAATVRQTPPRPGRNGQVYGRIQHSGRLALAAMRAALEGLDPHADLVAAVDRAPPA